MLGYSASSRATGSDASSRDVAAARVLGRDGGCAGSLASIDRVDQAVRQRPLGVEVQVVALGVADDLLERPARSAREDAVDLRLHLLQPVEVQRGGRGRLPACPLRRLVDHDPRVREREAASCARGLKHDRAHRVRHPLHHDASTTSAGHHLADDVVDGQPVGDVPAGGIEVERDRPVAVVGQLAQPFDDRSRAVLVDVTDEVDFPQALGRLLAEHLLDGIDQFGHEPVVQVRHRRVIS